MNKIKILVEGASDKDFLLLLLKFMGKDRYVDIYDCEGKDGIVNVKENLKDNLDAANTRDCSRILIIFDADNSIETAINNIEKQLKDLNFFNENIRIFLLPNNKDKGNLETLLEKIAKYQKILKCFDCYKECIENKQNVIPNLKTPNKKSKWFAYKEAFGYKNGIKKENFDISKYIDFNADYIKELKEFLISAFKENK